MEIIAFLAAAAFFLIAALIMLNTSSKKRRVLAAKERLADEGYLLEGYVVNDVHLSFPSDDHFEIEYIWGKDEAYDKRTIKFIRSNRLKSMKRAEFIDYVLGLDVPAEIRKDLLIVAKKRQRALSVISRIEFHNNHMHVRW